MDTPRPLAPIPDKLALALVAERLVYDRGVEIFLDIRPLLDENWTGIPVVTAALAETLIASLGAKLRFFAGADEIAQAAVWDALARSTGAFLQHDYEHHRAEARIGPIRPGAGPSIGIFPSAKLNRGLFDYECSIIHDVSTLVTPQYHTTENIAYHMEALQADLATNAITACVSAATAADLTAYLGIAPEKLVVAHNGIAWRAQDIAIATAELEDELIEPYFLILGTREPRKNLGLVVELLNVFPELLSTHRFVITGKEGWLQDNLVLPPSVQEALKAEKIFVTGFISDAEKCKLLMAAQATIYPSFFEGFGLPLVESLSLGTPCIASCTSSLPEIGGPFCTYFDPYSVLDLHRAITAFKRTAKKRDAAQRQAAQESVEKYSWTAMALAILQALEAKLPN
jgi:glycosyltransferase involved in cell wall biosynthesis